MLLLHHNPVMHLLGLAPRLSRNLRQWHISRVPYSLAIGAYAANGIRTRVPKSKVSDDWLLHYGGVNGDAGI